MEIQANNSQEFKLTASPEFGLNTLEVSTINLKTQEKPKEFQMNSSKGHQKLKINKGIQRFLFEKLKTQELQSGREE